MNDNEGKRTAAEEEKLKAAGIVSAAVWDTPKHRMKELTVLAATMTMPLSGVETVEGVWREIIEEQVRQARVYFKGVAGMAGIINKFAKNLELPSETLRLSLYGHNRSIKGDHLEHGRETVEGEIATKVADEEEEPVTQ